MMVVVRRMIWSVRTQDSGNTPRSHDEFVRSRSSQRVLFRSSGSTIALTILASPHACSDFMGLRLCGIVEDPTCFLPKLSSTSAISLLARLLISMHILSSVFTVFAIHITNSACLSLWIIWFETSRFNFEDLHGFFLYLYP